MSDPATLLDASTTQRNGFGPSCEALVVGAHGNRVDLHLVQSDGRCVSARVAVLGYAPAVGDRVLVHGPAQQCYVIGVLHSNPGAQPAEPRPLAAQLPLARLSKPRPPGAPDAFAPPADDTDARANQTGEDGAAAPPAGSLRTPDGARAELVGQSIEVHDRDGRLLVRYDSETSALTLSADADLNILAPHGNIQLRAAGSIELSGEHARVEARRLELESADADFAFGRIELRGERLLSKLTDAFVEVERVAETRAKRLRTLVETTLELVAQRTSIRSEKDTRIDGKRVLLG